MTDKEISKALKTESYSGVPFSDDELKRVPSKLKEVMIKLAKERYARNWRVAANAMCGACAVMIDVFAMDTAARKDNPR